jgi:hypothetical protein
MVSPGDILVHRFLYQAHAQDTGVEVEVFLGITGNGRNVM